MIKEIDPIGVTSPAVLSKMNEMIRLLNVLQVQLEYVERVVTALRSAAVKRGDLASQTTVRQHSSGEPDSALPPPPVVPPTPSDSPEDSHIETKLCYRGPTSPHQLHKWTEDRPGGRTFLCPGVW